MPIPPRLTEYFDTDPCSPVVAMSTMPAPMPGRPSRAIRLDDEDEHLRAVLNPGPGRSDREWAIVDDNVQAAETARRFVHQPLVPIFPVSV